MKKALILAYDFPPYVSVGGLRPFNWFKYLVEFEVFPIVVTRQWSNNYGNYLDYIAPGESQNEIVEKLENGIIIRAPYSPNVSNKLLTKYGPAKFKLIRKAISAYYEVIQFFSLTGPKASVYINALRYLKNNKVDVIIATGDPFILFRYASLLSDKFNIPWIADYRDPWSQKTPIQKNFFLKKWHSFFEKKYSSTSTRIVTVSEFLKQKISKTIPNKKIEILQNGFDPEIKDKVKDIDQEKEILNIGHIGTIYNWHPIEQFLNVLSQFLQQNQNYKIHLNFYGVNNEDGIKKIVDKLFTLNNAVTFYPKMANDLVLQAAAKNNLLLLFNYYSYMGTKIYDYLALNRKIILCFSDDPEANKLKKKYYDVEELRGSSTHLQQDLIQKVNSGVVVQDQDHLLKVLKDLYKEFATNGFISCSTYHIEEYSRKNQVKELARIIKDITTYN